MEQHKFVCMSHTLSYGCLSKSISISMRSTNEHLRVYNLTTPRLTSSCSPPCKLSAVDTRTYVLLKTRCHSTAGTNRFGSRSELSTQRLCHCEPRWCAHSHAFAATKGVLRQDRRCCSFSGSYTKQDRTGNKSRHLATPQVT